MAQTQIHGSTQIQANTVTSGQVDSTIVVAGGGNAFSGDQSMGGHKLTNVGTPSAGTDAANVSYVQAYVQGMTPKNAAQWATVGTETFTISSGNVTTISGTTLDAGSPAVGDRILIKDAPASTGAGSANSTQPGNGLYTVTGNTTNLSVSRTTDLTGSIKPTGSWVLVEEGTSNGGLQYIVTTPSNPDSSFTYGTDSIQWSRSSNGSGTVTTVSVVSTNGFAGSVANPSTSPAITISTSITGLVKGNGTAISAATVGTDYLAPSSRITRETPSGSINGSNTSFSLANTPTSGTEEVFLNGILQDAGSGNDYTISSSTITMLSPPLSGDKLRVSYFK